MTADHPQPRPFGPQNVNEKLAASLSVLLGGRGDLVMRLWSIASFVVAIRPSEFPNDRLREKHRRLSDMLIYLGMFDDDLNLSSPPFDGEDAVLVAMKFIELCRACSSARPDRRIR